LSDGWAFVDVETTGLNPAWDRVVSVSVLAFDRAGRQDGELHTLIDPQRDPGPVHIHGLTSERLRGAPLFHMVAPRVRELTAGRVLVAHNAQFDYRFLHAEAQRASTTLPTTHRLCTVALSRRLDLPVVNHKLATVAAYWGVRQHAAHDARDDVRVLREVFSHAEAYARRIGVELPVMSCEGRGAVVYPARVPRVASPYVNPKAWIPPARLVQGMKIVITGPTARPRLELAEDLAARGFDVMNSVSGQTRLVVCNEPAHVSVKHEKARSTGIPVVTEAQLVALLHDVEPGVVRGSKSRTATSPTTARTAAPSRTKAPAGPWAGRSVLVLGGSPDRAADVRERVGQLGARVLVNLGARTTHVLYLDGGETDRRHATIVERGLTRLGLSDLDDDLDHGTTPSTAASGATADHVVDSPGPGDAVVLGRGHVIDLAPDDLRLNLAASWQTTATGDEHTTYDVDLVAFALRSDGLVREDDDFVFYNQPSTPDGGIRLTIDGSCEQGVDLDLESLPADTTRIRVAAAIDGETTFGTVGAVHLSLTDADNGTEIASATLDAATDERTLVLAEVYQRGSTWRFRAVGQGYEHGLAQLATDHGIVVG
jgi:DNA polymerase-3 subunit epsilon